MPDRRKSYCTFRAYGRPVVNVLIVDRSGRNEESYPLNKHATGYGDIVKRYFSDASGVRADQFDWGRKNEASQGLAYAILEDHLHNSSTMSIDKDSYEYSLMDRFGAQFLWCEKCKPEHGLIITTESIDEWMDKISKADLAARANLNESERRGTEHEE